MNTSITVAPKLGISVVGENVETRLSTWVVRYWKEEVDRAPANTVAAKKRDLELFLSYFAETLNVDDIDAWTRSISRGFLQWLETRANGGKGYAPTTVNRVLATLRHFAKFVSEREGFSYGTPLEGITELVVDAPDWKGLTDVQVTRLRAALDQLEKVQTRKNQRPRRNRAMVLVFFGTAIRVSELLRLDLSHYRGKHFWDVKRKGKNRTRKLYIPQEAREALEEYLEHERGREPGPLFLSNGGERLARQHVDRFLKHIAAHANAKLPVGEHITLHAHKLRHTALSRAANRNGVQYAKELSGQVSDNHIWRYVMPAEEDQQAAQEELL